MAEHVENHRIQLSRYNRSLSCRGFHLLIIIASPGQVVPLVPVQMTGITTVDLRLLRFTKNFAAVFTDVL